MRYSELSTSARNLSVGDSHDGSTQFFFAATQLCARKLNQLDSNRPSPAKVAAVENAIGQAAFILESIDRKSSLTLPRRRNVP